MTSSCLTPLRRSVLVAMGPVLIGSLAVVSSFGARSEMVAGVSAPMLAAGLGRSAQTAGVTVSPDGELVGGGAAALSADGRYVAFVSSSPRLVPGDTNSSADVFVRDRVAQVTVRASVGPGGRQANGPSSRFFDAPAISANGRFVAFSSKASNLVPRDTNRRDDVFVRDLKQHVTWRVSLGRGGRQANGHSFEPAISGNGLRVVFASEASNLGTRDTNRHYDVFVRYRARKVTRLISTARTGRNANGFSFSPAISADGNWVAFASTATNLIRGDTNDTSDMFLHGPAKVTQRVSVGPRGRQANNGSDGPALSAHGRYIAFSSSASNLVSGGTRAESGVFVHDRAKRATELVSVGPGGRQANGPSFGDPSISANGRYVAFDSYATNLITGDSGFRQDVFMRDRVLKATTKVSIGLFGSPPNDESFALAISADGQHVAFGSVASNLVRRDTNNDEDVFVRD